MCKTELFDDVFPSRYANICLKEGYWEIADQWGREDQLRKEDQWSK
jgi:hypothetical protein